MVKHHILIGLGFKKQNFRNRGLQQMLRRASPTVSHFVGGATPPMTIMLVLLLNLAVLLVVLLNLTIK